LSRASPPSCSPPDDINGDYERITSRGAEFRMPPTKVTGSTIAQLNDTCENLIQISQLARG
jgi:predicted enzyme related to lactoylglutathione lyase